MCGRLRISDRTPQKTAIKAADRCGQCERIFLRQLKDLGREQADAAVMVLGVVPGKESSAEGACVLDRTEAVRKLGPIL
jgi:hypothetical protein